MKRILAIILASMMLFSMTGCGMEDLLSRFGESSPAGVTNTKRPELIGTWELVVTEEDPSAGSADETTEANEDSATADRPSVLFKIPRGGNFF